MPPTEPYQPTPALDEQCIELQLGRPLLTDSKVVHRCHFNLPVVSEAHPIDRKGRPFPTRFWLSCPLANVRVGRLEGNGGVVKLERRRQEASFQKQLDEAHADYAETRTAALDGVSAVHLPKGGVGGAREGIKCLHAHLAHHLGGGKNVIGGEVENQIGPLDCQVPCVIFVDDKMQKNADWHKEKLS